MIDIQPRRTLPSQLFNDARTNLVATTSMLIYYTFLHYFGWLSVFPPSTSFFRRQGCRCKVWTLDFQNPPYYFPYMVIMLRADRPIVVRM